eukprot:s4162_g12.t1
MMSQCLEDGATRLVTATEQPEEFIKKRCYASAELVMAAADGNVQKVEELLCNFADPNSKDGKRMLRLFTVNFSFEKRSTFDDRKADFWASEEEKVQHLCSAIAVIDWDARKRQRHYNQSISGTPRTCTPSNILHPSTLAEAISKIDSTRFLPVQEAACRKARCMVEWSRNFQWDAEHVSFGELLPELLSLKAQLGAELPELNTERLKAWGFDAELLMREGSLWFRSDAFFKYAMPSIFKCCHFSCAEVKLGWLPAIVWKTCCVFLRSEWLNREHLQLKFKGRDCGTGLATLLELLSRCTKLREADLQCPTPSWSLWDFGWPGAVRALAEDRWICAETPQKLALQLTEPIEVVKIFLEFDEREVTFQAKLSGVSLATYALSLELLACLPYCDLTHFRRFGARRVPASGLRPPGGRMQGPYSAVCNEPAPKK